METPATEIQYFLVIDGQKRGPFPLAGLIEAGMKYDTPVWWEGLESWPRAGKIPKLAALLKEERRRQLATRRADRLLEAEAIRWTGRVCLLANAPAALMYFIAGTALVTFPVLMVIAGRFVGPAPGGPDPLLARIAWWLLVGGIAGIVLGLPLLGLEAFCIGRLVWQCRILVRTAVPSHREEKAALEFVGDLTELGNADMGGPSLPTFDAEDLFRRGGMAGFHLAVMLLGGAGCLLVGPLVFCLIQPGMIVVGILFAIVLGVYVAIHVPMVIAMFMTIYRMGYGLNHVIDLYRLNVPWAPIALGFWTALCGMLIMAGPLSLLFFILLAIWTLRTSGSAARICDQDSRDIIAVPLPLPNAPPSKVAPSIAISREFPRS